MAVNWKLADDFDAELYRLICAADRNSAEAASPGHVEKWKEVYRALSLGRVHVRRMMREQDRATTE